MTRSDPKGDKGKDENKDNKVPDKDLDVIFSDVERKDEKNEGVSLDQKKELEQKKKDQEDNQLQSAVDIIKGIKIDRKFHG